MEITVYSKDGERRCEITQIEYSGEWMGECFVTFDVESPYPIEFAIGDWLEYRGERFSLHYEPTVVKQADEGTVGNSFKYEGVKFMSLAEEMVSADFLDYVLNDNEYHFSGLPEFSFFAETVKDLADRLQANMNRFSKQNGTPEWKFDVSDGAGGKTGVNISVSKLSCYEALALAQSEFGVNFTIRGRIVTIGGQGMTFDHVFMMGRNLNGGINGLYEIERNAETDQKIVTRLRAYGNTRNMPRRYYNSLTDADGEKFVPDNMAVQRLMLPDFPRKTLDPYIDSENIGELGVLEGTVIFDGSDDLEDIYPSIAEATADQLRAAGYASASEGRIDELVWGQIVEDDGIGYEIEGEIYPGTMPEDGRAPEGLTEEMLFKVEVKDWGFSIMDLLTDEEPKLSFTSGMLGGRDFEICTDEKHKPEYSSVTHTWTLTLKRVYDEAIDRWFPYEYYNAREGDRFVVLGIDMPEIYIKMSAQRLEEAARAWLKENDFSRSVYTPKVDEIYMASQHRDYERGEERRSYHLEIKEGDLLTFEDESLRIGSSSIFIDKLVIKEGEGPVPTYDITLREEKVVGTLQRIENKIDSVIRGEGGGGGGLGSDQIRELVLAFGQRYFLRKDGVEDTSVSPTHFNADLSTSRFTSDAESGTGWAIYQKGAKWHFEADGLTIRGDGVINGHLWNTSFVRSITKGEGWGIYKDSEGRWNFEGDFLQVRKGGYVNGEFLKHSEFIQGILNGKEWAIYKDNDGSWQFEIDGLTVREHSAFGGNLSNADFESGFIGGKGWAITSRAVKNATGQEETKYTLEIDDLVVRGAMRIYEMIISQLLGENDNRIFTAMLEVDHYDPETGIIWLDTQGGSMYNPFRKGDYIMVQQYQGMPSEENGYYITKEYELIITDAGIGNQDDGADRLDWVKFKNFTTTIEGGVAEGLIREGDTLVRVDNEFDEDRKGIIQIISVGSKTPYIDIIKGLKTDPDDYLKGRLGNLEGIRHHLFGWLEGYGAYLGNLYAVGDFRLRRTGESLDTQFEILRERFSSRYTQLTYDITEEENYLYNPSFTQNMEGWSVKKDTTSLVMDDDGLDFLLNGNLLLTDSERGGETGYAMLDDYDGSQMLHVLKSGIRQSNAKILAKMAEYGLELQHYVYGDGETEGSLYEDEETQADVALAEGRSKEDSTLYLGIKILPLSSGKLTIGFSGGGGGLAEQSVEISKSAEWQTLEWAGTWDGKGDFVLDYDGELYLSLLSLTAEPLSDLKREIGTQIEQSASNIKLVAWNVNENKKEAGILINALDNSVKIWAQETRQNGEDIAYLKVESDQITARVESAEGNIGELKVTAEQIEERVDSIEGNYASLRVTADSIQSEVNDMQGNISSIIETAYGIEQRVTDAEGKYASLELTASGIASEVSDMQGNISQIEQTANSLSATISDVAGDVVSIKAEVTEQGAKLEQKVSADGVIAAINLTAQADGSQVKILADKISLKGYTEINNFIIDEAGDVTINGKMKGMIRFSTAYQGNISNSQIFYFGETDDPREMSMGSESDDVGKVVWFYNKSQYTHRIYGCQFNVSGGGRVNETYGYAIGPQEAIQMTCFQISETRAEWIMTQRLSYQQFHGDNYNGRYPLLWGTGTMTVNPSDWSVKISGNRYDATALNGLISVERTDYGNYKFTFASGTLPANYFIMCQPLTMYDTWRNAKENISASVTVVSKSATEIVFACSDDESSNDCSFDFMIYDTSNWYYAR